MPTSVGPKSKGKDNLVFGYDTGDTVNSYKGEPTEPLRGTFPTDTEFPTGYHWTYEYDHEIVDAPVSNHFLSNKKWIKSTRDTTGSRRVLFLNNSFTSGSTYTFSCYVYSDDSRLTSLEQLSHNGGYSAHQGGTIYTSADLGKVKRIHGTWIQQQNGSSIYGMQTNNAALGTTFYMTGLQVEEKANPTQLTAGSRSADSGSLIDLTGNSTIDLTNVSFDSNAQMTFNGTDDYINFAAGTMPNFGTNDFAIEVVFKMTKTTSYSHFYQVKDQYHFALKMSNANQRIYVYRTSGLSSFNDIAADTTLGAWHHLVCQRNGDNVEMYLNGDYKGSKSGWGSIDIEGDTYDTIIGKYNNEYSQGDQPITKIYNRALTASEIKANFNAIKGRFNI